MADLGFDNKKYWLDRKSNAADRRAQRLAKKYANIVGFHKEVDWPRKQPTKKAVLKQTKRARREITHAS